MRIFPTALVFISGILPLGLGAQLPRPSGPYNAGVRRFVQPFFTNNTQNEHPWIPRTVHEYLVTVYYPTLAPSVPAPYLDPELAKMIEIEWDFKERGVLANLEAHRVWDAPFLDEQVGPTIIFEGRVIFPPTDANTVLLSDLASHGYTVVAIDHPGETTFLRMPNGTIVHGGCGLRCLEGSIMFMYTASSQVRREKAIDLMERWPSIVEEWGAPFATDKFGLLGYEMGGSTMIDVANRSTVAAVAAVATDRLAGEYSRVYGFKWLRKDHPYGHAKVFKKGLDKFGLDIKVPGLVLGWDRGMSRRYWMASLLPRAWHRWIVIERTELLDFCDAAIWKHLGVGLLSSWDVLFTAATTERHFAFGTMDGYKVANLTTRIVRSFFDRHMRNGPADAILDEPTEKGTEVLVRRASFQTKKLGKAYQSYGRRKKYPLAPLCMMNDWHPRLSLKYYQTAGEANETCDENGKRLDVVKPPRNYKRCARWFPYGGAGKKRKGKGGKKKKAKDEGQPEDEGQMPEEEQMEEEEGQMEVEERHMREDEGETDEYEEEEEEDYDDDEVEEGEEEMDEGEEEEEEDWEDAL